MATGIIESITSVNGDLKAGTVLTDETRDVLQFKAQQITCDVGDPVSFDITINQGGNSIATGMVCIAGEVDHPLSPITGIVNDNLTVAENQKLTIRNGGNVTGNISINGGKVRVAGGGNVTGNISINNSGTLRVVGGTTTGDVSAVNAEIIRISSGGNVTGNISVNSGHRMVIEDGSIGGSLSVQDTYKIAVKSNATIG